MIRNPTKERYPAPRDHLDGAGSLLQVLSFGPRCRLSTLWSVAWYHLVPRLQASVLQSGATEASKVSSSLTLLGFVPTTPSPTLSTSVPASWPRMPARISHSPRKRRTPARATSRNTHRRETRKITQATNAMIQPGRWGRVPRGPGPKASAESFFRDSERSLASVEAQARRRLVVSCESLSNRAARVS